MTAIASSFPLPSVRRKKRKGVADSPPRTGSGVFQNVGDGYAQATINVEGKSFNVFVQGTFPALPVAPKKNWELVGPLPEKGENAFLARFVEVRYPVRQFAKAG